jgi:hypothetical protein
MMVALSGMEQTHMLTATASPWNTTLTTHELDAHYALTASIDPRFAREERAFYESRTLNQLKVLAAQSWNCCEPTGYQMARSYVALMEG